VQRRQAAPVHAQVRASVCSYEIIMHERPSLLSSWEKSRLGHFKPNMTNDWNLSPIGYGH